MQTYELLVTNRAVRANSSDTTLVRTSVGVDMVHVMFDNEEWLSFPLTITFAQRDVNAITIPLTVSRIVDSDKWCAEATVTVPHEVIEMVGPIRVTFQGTDASGNHIITAAGSPLSVEEAGDVDMGEAPEDAPSVSDWQRYRSEAQALLNEVQTLKNTLQGQLDAMVQAARESLDEEIATSVSVATTESVGVVQVGTGLSITEEGLLSAAATNGITAEQASQIANLASLAYYCFDTTFDENGLLQEGAKVKAASVPIDGTTIKIDGEGRLAMGITFADSGVY